MQAEVEKREAIARGGGGAVKKVQVPVLDETPIPENINRLQPEGDIARTVDEAIKVLRYSPPFILKC